MNENELRDALDLGRKRRTLKDTMSDIAKSLKQAKQESLKPRSLTKARELASAVKCVGSGRRVKAVETTVDNVVDALEGRKTWAELLSR